MLCGSHIKIWNLELGRQIHIGIIGESKTTRASKGRRQGSWGVKDWGLRDQGRQGSGGGSGVKIRASGFRSSNVPGVKGDESEHQTLIFQYFDVLCFVFFHVVCKISNFNKWTAKHLAQASCTELTLCSWLKHNHSSKCSWIHYKFLEVFLFSCTCVSTGFFLHNFIIISWMTNYKPEDFRALLTLCFV
jgi:hypothetical protein